MVRLVLVLVVLRVLKAIGQRVSRLVAARVLSIEMRPRVVFPCVAAVDCWSICTILDNFVSSLNGRGRFAHPI